MIPQLSPPAVVEVTQTWLVLSLLGGCARGAGHLSVELLLPCLA